MEKLSVHTMRSPLGRVRGLGSAKSGTAHWWAQRVTALAILPLSLWFILSMVALSGGNAQMLAGWAASPCNAALLIGLILATFYHLQLGLQVVIEDYIKPGITKMVTLLVVRGLSTLLGLVCIISVLKISVFGTFGSMLLRTMR